MTQSHLSEYFKGAAGKILSRVEVESSISHQHEFNGVASLKSILGTDRQSFDTLFLYLNDEGAANPIIKDKGTLTWYDAREAHPTRSEYRLYFSPNEVMNQAKVGDFIIIAVRTDGNLVAILSPSNSDICLYVCKLFNLSMGERFNITDARTDQNKLTYSKKLLLEAMNINVYQDESSYVPEMLKLFNGQFPSTKVFSQFARSTIPNITAQDDPDVVLLAWMEREEGLFRALERHFVDARISDGFKGTDDFLSYALSILNRRKSRVGQALENHIEQIFIDRDIAYARTCVTEHKSKPDFIFPSSEAYHDSTVDAVFLSMLGVKTTCKDRWRQILAEADKVEIKHLLTLEEGISENQTTEMNDHKVRLVVPKPLHSTYTLKQQQWLMSFDDFILYIAQKQERMLKRQSNKILL